MPLSLKDDDEAAAAHYRIFHLETLPYASVFLESNQLLGGAHTQKIQQFFLSHHFDSRRLELQPDHLGTQLAFLSHLCREGIYNQVPEEEKHTQYTQEATRVFLHDHLLSWLSSYVLSLEPQEIDKDIRDCFAFYHKTVLFILDLATNHAFELGIGAENAIKLPPLDPVLETNECGIKDIATYFSTPAQCGSMLRKNDIQRIGRKLNLPTGFGRRADMLEKLFLCAAEYGSISDVFDAIHLHLKGCITFYQSIESAGHWLTRCAQNLERIESLKGKLAQKN